VLPRDVDVPGEALAVVGERVVDELLEVVEPPLVEGA
jgi:hypothetical protein